MTPVTWRILYILLFGFFVFALHKWIGKYPAPLERSEKPKQELRNVIILGCVALITPVLRQNILSPWISPLDISQTLKELLNALLLTIPYLIIPLLMAKQQKGGLKDMGLRWRVESTEVAVAAVLFGLGSGSIAFLNSQAVIGMNPLPFGVLGLLLYSNAFLEEFFHRGAIQSRLERWLGQGKAIIFGGLFFGLTHILFDINQLLIPQGILFVFFAFILQVLGGWLLGIVFIKTRSLWPGVTCHYLTNWLPSILTGLYG